MNKTILSVLAVTVLTTAAMAVQGGVPGAINDLDQRVTALEGQGPAADGADGADGDRGKRGKKGTSGTNGTDGTNGKNGKNGVDGTEGFGYLYKQDRTRERQQRAAATATASVELNPDHEGWSVGMGVSPTRGTFAGAVGVMYSEKLSNRNDGIQTVGYNIKAYQAVGGYNGVGVGVTIGF